MPFLTARWEDLVLLNFDCPAALLEPLVPPGLELDAWQGSHVVSLVGFRFVDTRILGLPIPWHRSFEEVNLRFYVRRRLPDSSARRGVVFVREIVPRAAVAAVARWLYNEPYRTARMEHRVSLDSTTGGNLEYRWNRGEGVHSMSARAEGPAPDRLEPGSEAEFITEHYWGYGRRRDGGTLEYRVHHPPWRVWKAISSTYTSPPGSELYPSGFDEILATDPRSAFVTLGSEVIVYRGRSPNGAG